MRHVQTTALLHMQSSIVTESLQFNINRNTFFPKFVVKTFFLFAEDHTGKLLYMWHYRVGLEPTLAGEVESYLVLGCYDMFSGGVLGNRTQRCGIDRTITLHNQVGGSRRSTYATKTRCATWFSIAVRRSTYKANGIPHVTKLC